MAGAAIRPWDEADRPVNPYDDVPYPSHAFAATAPDRLAVLGRLFGLHAPDPRTARVLELGSSSGGNLLGHAAAHPRSLALGLDLSPRQISAGQDTVEALGLTNLRLEVADLATWRPEPGAWDYVICHGVWSWVPPHVQDAILAIVARALSPHGVGLVSTNAHPGWHVQGMVRDAMRALVDPSLPLAHRAARAQDVVRVLAHAAPDPTSPHARTLALVAAQLELVPDSYVAHEYLEAHNAPTYRAEITQRVTHAGLRYLCDSSLASTLPQLLPPALQAPLTRLGTSQVALEQYLDFFTCRTFHSSLVVRPDAPVCRDLNAFDPAHLWVRREEPPPEAADPIWAAFLHAAHAAWPAAVAFDTAAARAGCQEPAVRAALANAALSAFLTGELGLHAHPHAQISAPGPRPTAWPYARWLSARRHLVTSLLHDTHALEPLDLLLLLHADGTRTRDDLALEAHAALAADPDAQPDDRPADLTWATERVSTRLDALAGLGFFVA